MASLLLLVSNLPTSIASAGYFGSPTAACGGLMMTVDELKASVDGGLAPTDFSPLNFTEPNLTAFAKTLDRFDEKEAGTAREILAKYLSRKDLPEVRTTATLFSGKGAIDFLKKGATNADEIGAQAAKNRVLKKWVIGFFGVASLQAFAGIPNIVGMDRAEWWYIIPVALIGAEFGAPVVKALLRLRESPLEKFMVEDFAKIGASAEKSDALHILSLTARKTSDFKTVVTAEENARAPWAQEIVLNSRLWGDTRVRRIARGKNPLVIPRKTVRVDLISIPYGTAGERQILVLTSEGI
jgi:hypothetical protein